MLDYEHGSLQESFLLPVSPLPAHPPQVYQSEYLKQKLSSEFPVQIFNDHLPPCLYSSAQTPLLSPGASPVCPLQTKPLDGLCRRASFCRIPMLWLCYLLPETSLLFSADPKPIFLSRLCFVGLWCVCVGCQDRPWVPEAGSIAILISLVPSSLLGTEQAGMNCLQGLHYYFTVSPCLFFFKELQIFR